MSRHARDHRIRRVLAPHLAVLAVAGLAGAADADPGRIEVFFGSRDGEPVEGGAYEVGTAGPWLEVGDLNGDGIPDIVFVDGASGSPGVLLGTGHGRFERVISRRREFGSARGSLRDMNADGKLDLVLFNESGEFGAVLEGRGDGTFFPPKSFRLGEGHASLRGGNMFGAVPRLLEDLDGDGRMDLISANGRDMYPFRFSSGFTVRRGLPEGTFTEPVFSDTLSTPAMIVDDFNGDGVPDLAATHWVTGVFVYPGRGDGTFRDPVRACTGLGAFHLASGDLNGDGKCDLVVSSLISGLTVLRGNGDGTFTGPDSTVFVEMPSREEVQELLDELPVRYAIGDTPYDCGSWNLEGAGQVGIGDWNGDGAEDVVVRSTFKQESICFLRGRGDGNLEMGRRIERAPVSALVVADLNGDGLSDVVMGYGTPPWKLSTKPRPWKPPGPSPFTHGTLTLGVVSPQGEGLQYGSTGWGLDLRLVPRIAMPGPTVLWTDLGFNIYPGTDSTGVVTYGGSEITARSQLEWSIHMHAGLQVGSRSRRAALRPRFGLGPGLYYFGIDEIIDNRDVHFQEFNYQIRAGWRAILGLDIGNPRGTALNLEVVYDHVWNLDQLPGGFGAEGGGRFLTFRVGAMISTARTEPPAGKEP